MINEWQQRIVEAAATKQYLNIEGGNSKRFYGQTIVGQRLSTQTYSGIVSYEPTELVVTVKCGTPLAELEATLANEAQMLAFEPPHFGAATVGGCVATGLSGPRRARVGSLRDFVLGAQLLDGTGKLLNFGGQVMKNVAGYDVSRLLAGSLGMFGIITEVSFKVLPLPAATSTCVLEYSQAEALAAMANWARLPLPISATAWHKGLLHLRLSGADSAVAAAEREIGGEQLNEIEANDFWLTLKEHRHRFFNNDGRSLWRIALPANSPALATRDEDILLEWNGTQRWLRGDYTTSTLRAQVGALGGHTCLFSGDKKHDGVFEPLSPTLLHIHKNLKQGFDPQGLFNRGRMYAEL